jgi:hypothetical protein
LDRAKRLLGCLTLGSALYPGHGDLGFAHGLCNALLPAFGPLCCGPCGDALFESVGFPKRDARDVAQAMGNIVG